MRSLRMTLVVSVMIVLSLSFAVSSSYSGEINLPKTGQTSSYATGDDGQLQEGVAWPSPRFQDMGNGTIKDNLTGLIWLKDGNCTANLGGVNKTGSLSWQDALTWTNNLANGYCGLSDSSTVGDWRLPNINELKSLVNIGVNNMATWLSGVGFQNIQGSHYWTSTTYAATPGNAWFTDMSTGNSGGDGKTVAHYVLPVKGGQDGVPVSTYPANIPKTGQTTQHATGDDGQLQKGVTWPNPRFSITYCNNSGPCPNQTSDCDSNASTDIVRDNLTGLTWPRDGSLGSGKTWADALTFANTFTLCGMSGWRLPNLNELASLMNFGASDMSVWLNENNFVNVPASSFWTSSTDTSTTDNAWYANLASGSINTLSKSTTYYAWPVKSPCADPPSGMLSWWKAEDNANDSFGGNHGTAQGGLTYAPGKVGKAFSFNGTNGYVEVPDSNSLDLTTAMTIEAWINPTSLGGIITDKHTDGNTDGYMLDIHSNKLRFVVGDKTLTSIADLQANTWTHVAGTYDGNALKVYINGALDSSLPSSITIPTNNLPLRIGADSSGGNLFNGLIDEVTIYNRALTAEEIGSIYMAGSGGKCLVYNQPNSFSFIPLSGVGLGSVITSNKITVSGISSSVPISITNCTGTNCQYRINNGSWTSNAGTVNDGDTVEVRQTSSNAYYDHSTTLTLDIGGVTGDFTVTTRSNDKCSLMINKEGTNAYTAVINSPSYTVNCSGTCALQADADAKVTLLFSPTPSWIQVGTNPSISGTNALTIRELNADTTITVNFP